MEAVRNGDFSDGYIPGDFSTSETYSTLAQVNPDSENEACNWSSSGQFYISSNDVPSACGGKWGARWVGTPFNPDYGTSGIDGPSDVVMYVDPGTTSPKLWEQTVNVIGGERYYFSFWYVPINAGFTDGSFVMSVDDAALTINPGETRSFQDTIITPVVNADNEFVRNADGSIKKDIAIGTITWTQLNAVYDVPAGTSSLKLTIGATGVMISGYELAMDKISFINGCDNLVSANRALFDEANYNLCTSGGSVDLTAKYEGDPDLSNNTYTWYKDGSEVGAGSLTLNNITSTGDYVICVDDNDNGCPVTTTIQVIEDMSGSFS